MLQFGVNMLQRVDGKPLALFFTCLEQQIMILKLLTFFLLLRGLEGNESFQKRGISWRGMGEKINTNTLSHKNFQIKKKKKNQKGICALKLFPSLDGKIWVFLFFSLMWNFLSCIPVCSVDCFSSLTLVCSRQSEKMTYQL